MAICRMNFRSEVLGKMTSVNVYLPDQLPGRKRAPLLYLLHGRSDDCHTWLNATSLERYAGAYPFVIVMPQVELSYYTDMVHGDRYWTYLTEELPEKIGNWFQVTQGPSRTFVAGLSMGGYGAFKWALQNPKAFRGVASLSGALDVVALWRRDPLREQAFTTIFGSITALKNSRDNLLLLLSDENVQAHSDCHFLQICGTEDFLYQDNQTFRQAINQSPYGGQYVYQEFPGDHNWAFWDLTIQIVLKKFDELLEC